MNTGSGSGSSLDEDIALRIGLASQLIADRVSLEGFVSILIRSVGRPITQQRLSRLRLRRFKEASRGAFRSIPDEKLKQVLNTLKDPEPAQQALLQALPMIDHYQPGDMPGSIRVACCSYRGDRIDGSFGTCERFLIYQVSASEYRLIDIREKPATRTALPSVKVTREERYHRRLTTLDDCHVLYALTIGAPAAAQVVNAGLHPIKLGAPRSTGEVLEQLQQALEGNPAPWLMKIMEASARSTWENQASNQQEMTL